MSLGSQPSNRRVNCQRSAGSRGTPYRSRFFCLWNICSPVSVIPPPGISAKMMSSEDRKYRYHLLEPECHDHPHFFAFQFFWRLTERPPHSEVLPMIERPSTLTLTTRYAGPYREPG